MTYGIKRAVFSCKVSLAGSSIKEGWGNILEPLRRLRTFLHSPSEVQLELELEEGAVAQGGGGRSMGEDPRVRTNIHSTGPPGRS